MPLPPQTLGRPYGLPVASPEPEREGVLYLVLDGGPPQPPTVVLARRQFGQAFGKTGQYLRQQSRPLGVGVQAGSVSVRSSGQHV